MLPCVGLGKDAHNDLNQFCTRGISPLCDRRVVLRAFGQEVRPVVVRGGRLQPPLQRCVDIANEVSEQSAVLDSRSE